MAEFLMPSLGADMEEGTLLSWLVHPGDHVTKGDIVAEVDTDKATLEIEVFETGVVKELLVAEGTTVPVGAVLAIIESDEAAEPGRPPPAVTPPAKAEAEPQRRPVTPRARALAGELGVDLGSVTATGPDGAITEADVRAAAGGAAPPDRAAAMRRATGELMARSKRDIPHYYLRTDIDLEPAYAWLEEHNAGRPPEERVILAPLLLRAVAVATRKVPEMNGAYSDGFVGSADVHMGVAVSLRDAGLVAPALRDLDKKDVVTVMSELRDLVQRARAGRLRSSEVSDATITVTNLGERGADEVYGVIYPPQVALVGFGRPMLRAYAVDDGVVARMMITATLSADHRASDGHRGSIFLNEIAELLRSPGAL